MRLIKLFCLENLHVGGKTECGFYVALNWSLQCLTQNHNTMRGQKQQEIT